jgi:protein phosphatase
MICAKCNFQNEESAKFCRNCGANLSAIKICPKCNYQGTAGARFCKNCGTAMVDETISPILQSKDQPHVSPPPAEIKPPIVPASQTQEAHAANQTKNQAAG